MRLRTRKKVSNSLQIDFHVRDFDKILQMRVAFNNRLEDLFRYSRNDSFEIQRVDVRSLGINEAPALNNRDYKLPTIIVKVFPLPV